jgi:RecA-family ATPase
MIDLSMLEVIPPDCGYDEWLKVGMALKHEGATCDIWDRWSAGGSKYKQGECAKKWRSFNRNDVTGGTLFHIATQYGYAPAMDDTDYDIHNLLLDEYIVDQTFVSMERVPEPPKDYNPKGDMLEYFSTLFHDDDFVGYCTSFFKNEEGEWKPAQTVYRRTAGDIIEKLRIGSIEKAIGTLNKEAGAYVRFNPLDGKGENNSNVTRWKYCLIESDEDSIEKQYSLIKAMNLPAAFLIHSGGKSLHAIIKVDAENSQQYKSRVRELYDFCKKSGLQPDEQDKNESRFSRLPGVMRNGKWQWIVERNIGAESYDAWIEWRKSQADDLPQDVKLSDVWNNMPELKEELIPGILRVGHKMLLAGPSKAGKSFMLINLAISIAEGVDWIGLKCKQGRVCYINLELDSASCFHRFKEIYAKRGLDPNHVDDIDIWNLRGHAAPMDRLAPIIIHRFKDKAYSAVIIDPIYKIITGDENNATEMSKFCSYFDQVATEMNVSVIYCHHHSKGAGGKYANAADRSSGSGVFARDPDAILDLRELNVTGLMDKYKSRHENACEVLTAWELSGTLREFAPAAPRRIWFDYPVHVPDDENYLAVATYNDSGSKGVGEEQKGKTDWYEIVSELLEISSDTAVTLEAVGISETNAKKKFGKDTDYEVATIEDVKVVHRRQENEIKYLGKKYGRQKAGRGDRWVPSSE